MIFRAQHNLRPTPATPVGLRCSNCGHQGTFAGRNDTPDLSWNDDAANSWQGGIRRCPNPDCRAVAFVILLDGRLYERYPSETIDFDTSNLPENILSSLEEAVKCHSSHAYKASALMVRRLLEELCADRGSTGKDLKARLSNLGNSVVIPKELLEAADELRLLGNDAAHIEAKSYDRIGKDEAALAIELAKELLKAVYQYANLVEKLRALKRDSSDT